MPYEIHRNARASRDFRQFARYLRDEAGQRVARYYLEALEHDLEIVIANNPHAFSWFHETGAPYRAKLFKLARTRFWIIYTVDDARQRVEIIRLWHAARQAALHHPDAALFRREGVQRDHGP